MTNVLTKVRSRGSWTVRIRPIDFKENRIDKLGALVDAVRNAHVELRGWDFPHFSPKQDPRRTADYVEQDIDWEHYVELWRAYKSGQFISICALHGDWRDQSSLWPPYEGWKAGDTLGVEDAIFRFVEIFEFAARWARAVPIGEEVSVECVLSGLKNRALTISPRRGLSSNYDSSVNEFKWEQRYSTAVLFSAPRQNAISPSIKLLELFRWDATEEFIRDVQGELRA